MHNTHQLLYTKGVTFCTACGAWATEHPKKLGHPCGAAASPPVPLTTAGQTALKRLHEGKHPQYNGVWPKPDDHSIGKYALMTMVPAPRKTPRSMPRPAEDSD